MSDFVTLFEMGPRDGLQNEKLFVPTAQKIELVDRLSACGFRKIEVTSFVSPKWVPQMADALEVMEGIYRHPAVVYTALTPNVKGYTARRASVDEVAIFGSASEGFSKKNINCSVAESIERFKPLLEKAQQDDMPVRGYVSCVTDCPYDGPTPPEKVARGRRTFCSNWAVTRFRSGTRSVPALRTPSAVCWMPCWRWSRQTSLPATTTTPRAGLWTTSRQSGKGFRTFDSAIGGLGGCPYAPGAKGNVATEAVVDLLVRERFRNRAQAGPACLKSPNSPRP